MYVDYKAIMWFRIPIGDTEILNKVTELVENGTTINQLYYAIDKDFIGSPVPIPDTEHILMPPDNDNRPTIEVFNEGNKIWHNTIWNDIYHIYCHEHNIIKQHISEPDAKAFIFKFAPLHISRYMQIALNHDVYTDLP